MQRAVLVGQRDAVHQKGGVAQGGDALHPHLSWAPTHDMASGDRLQTTHGTETVSSNSCLTGVTGLAVVFQLWQHIHNIFSS